MVEPVRRPDPQPFQPRRSSPTTDHHAAVKYTITHRTLYHYSSGVALCHNQAWLLPREASWQRCRPSRITIQPRPALSVERQDFFGN
ncbi:MAG: hypothetical protein KDJ70_11830, partial [Candidatus Competibacteraceae bacterium]|nr:hypothetical protein [Candidatus Competibacteraceae bacterium]